MYSNDISRSSHEIVHISEEDDILFRCIRDTGSYIATHWHNSLELIYLKSGELDVTQNNTKIQLKANDILLINSGTPHGTKCVKGNDSVLVIFPYRFIKKYIPNLGSLYFSLNSTAAAPQLQPALDRTRELLDRMLSLQASPFEGSKLKFTSLLFELLYTIHENFKTDLRLTDTNRHNKNLFRLEPVIWYTRTHYNNPVSISEIASIAGFRPEYFCRFFKKNMGITYLEYLSEVRLAFLYQDLLTTDLPISCLLETHGFTNYKLFRRMFQDRFHGTPVEIRNKYKTNPT